MSETKNHPIRTRMAPSPTGEMHIGTLRTGLYAYAFARKHQGQFILRIEDTDQKRLVEGSGQRVLKTFKDFGLIYDEGPDVGGPYGPYVQTERLDIYKQHIKQLIDLGHAYYCFCSQERLDEVRALQKASKKIPKYDRYCLNLSKEQIEKNLKEGLPHVVRMRIPDNETIIFKDLIRGEIKFNTNDLDDQVLIKSNGIPTYHFAVVVDDHLMKISHIIRAEEWISSTPKHILLYRYFGWEIPEIAHLTVLLDPSHPGKMSKRHGSVFAHQFLEEGYLPDALLNFLMLLGWNPGTNQEIFTLDEFIEAFSVEHLHKKAAIFDRKKLDYFNGLYIRQKTDEELYPYFSKFIPQSPPEITKALVPLLRERITRFSELPDLTRYLFEDVDYDPALLLSRGVTASEATEYLTHAQNVLTSLKDFNFADIQTKLLDLIAANNWHTGKFFMVFRVAIAGAPITPPIVETLPLLGQQKTISRLRFALDKLANLHSNN